MKNKLKVKRAVLNRARRTVKESQPVPAAAAPPQGPFVLLSYPRHGVGTLTERIVQVVEADAESVRGFEGSQYKTFSKAKIVGPVELLTLTPPDDE